MEISLSQNLKALRFKHGNTQEDLANFLGISAQSVSKWERNEGYPDITLLPKIAGYYHTTVDELLGVGEFNKEARIREITEEYNQLKNSVPLDPDFHLEEGIELIRNALNELPGVFFFEQLLAADLYQKGKICDNKIKKELYEEAITLCKDILDRSTDQAWRNCANEILLVIFADLGKTDEAFKLAEEMPTPFCTRDYMLTYILKDDDLINRYKLNAVTYYNIFRESIIKLNSFNIPLIEMPNKNELSVHGIEYNEFTLAIENIVNKL